MAVDTNAWRAEQRVRRLRHTWVNRQGCGSNARTFFLRWSGAGATGATVTCNEATALHERAGRAERPRRCSEVVSRRSIPTRKGGHDDGQESSQGREEEGRQEAVILPSRQGKGAIVAPFFFVTPRSFRSSQFHAVPDPHALDDVPLRHLIEYLPTTNHTAEGGVLRVEVRLR